MRVPFEPMVYQLEVSRPGAESFDASLPIFEEDWTFHDGMALVSPRAAETTARRMEMRRSRSNGKIKKDAIANDELHAQWLKERRKPSQSISSSTYV
jgi:hypothetical protein